MTSTALPRSSWTTSQNVFLLDAVVSGAMAVGLLAAASPLSPILGLDGGLLRWAAFILLPFAATVAFFALRRPMPRSAMWAVIGCNVLWVADSVLLLMTDWVQPTTLGAVFVIGQGAAVVILAVWESYVARNSK